MTKEKVFPKSPVVPLKKSSKNTARFLWLSTTSVLIALLAIFISLLLWKQIGEIRVNSNALSRNFSSSLNQLKQNQENFHINMQNSVNENQESILKVLHQRGNVSSEQAYGEAIYLIQLAQLHLQYGNDPQGAIDLLLLAKIHLKEFNTTKINKLRLALTNDIKVLKALPITNKDALVERLDKISVKVAELPIVSSFEPKANDKATDETSTPSPVVPEKSTWADKIKENLGALKKLIVIERTDRKPAYIEPESLALIKLNIQTKLAQAQWAALHGRPHLYKTSLTVATDWLQQYTQHEEEASALADELTKLLVVNIAPKVDKLLLSITSRSSQGMKNNPEAKPLRSQPKGPAADIPEIKRSPIKSKDSAADISNIKSLPPKLKKSAADISEKEVE